MRSVGWRCAADIGGDAPSLKRCSFRFLHNPVREQCNTPVVRQGGGPANVASAVLESFRRKPLPQRIPHSQSDGAPGGDSRYRPERIV